MIGSKKMKQITAPTAMAISDQTMRSRSSRRWSTTDIVPVGSAFFFPFFFSARRSASFQATDRYRESGSAGRSGGAASPEDEDSLSGAGPFCGVTVSIGA
jgi:hypothetical protein